MDVVKPFVSLCVMFRDNADTLPALLDSVAEHFDEYVFLDTGSVDGSRALVDAFLKDRAGSVSEYAWNDNFGAARQANFEAATGLYRMFLDSDDVLVKGERVRALLRQCEAKCPELQGFFVEYRYAHLETLMTMRLVKWRPPGPNGRWVWNDAIHERLEFQYPDGEGLPESAFGRTDEFHVVHKDKSPDSKAVAIRRNAAIARRDFETTTDPKYRARLGRTLAMEAKMDGKAAEAVPWLEDLYRHYRTYPEGRQAAADIAKSYMHLAETLPKDAHNPSALENARAHYRYLEFALEWARKAGPAYEALVYHLRGDYDAVLKAVQRSAGMGPQTTHEGLIFEQGACYVAAAAAAMELGLGPAVAERLLNYIPPEIRNDATIVSHVNSIRHAIDRITIVVPGTPQPFDENGGGGMLGGSEEAVMYLTRALAKQGRNVRVYGVLPPHRLPGPDRFGVDWRDAREFKPDDEHGTLVLWRAPAMLLNLMNQAAKLGRHYGGVLQVYLWLHDTGLGVSGTALEAVSKGASGAVVLSDFHAEMIRRQGYTGKLFKAANGIVEEDFEPFIDAESFDFEDHHAHDVGSDRSFGERDRYSVVYSSCPSRGLVPLLKMWPAVKAEVPQATLDVYYDWSMLEQMNPRKYEEVMTAYEAVKHLDVVHHGGVDHATLHSALRRASVWAYSHFESPEVETSCISLMKALACGAHVLTVPNGALPETGRDLAQFVGTPEEYRSALVEALQNPRPGEVRREAARKTLERYGWARVAEGFGQLWSIRHVLDTAKATASDNVKSTDQLVEESGAGTVTEAAT